MKEKKEITCVEECKTLSEFWSFTGLMNRQKPRSISLQEMYKYGELKANEAVESKFVPKELTKETLAKYAKSHYLTVGKLKSFLDEHSLVDGAIVVVQRVEDVYYKKNNWCSYLKKGYHTYNAEQWNEDIEAGKYLDKEQYPNMKEENLISLTEEQIKESMEQYSPVFCCVRYKDDEDVLFLDLHY